MCRWNFCAYWRTKSEMPLLEPEYNYTNLSGEIGAKGAAKGFKRIGQIEKSFVKYAKRDITKYGKSIINTFGKRGSKYISEFILPTVKDEVFSKTSSLIMDTSYYWGNKIFAI